MFKYDYNNIQHQNLLKQLTLQLRKKTGRGIMICRQALIQANFEINKAQKLLNINEKFSWQKEHIEKK